VVSWELTHPAWGEGLATGLILPPPERGDGTVLTATRAARCAGSRSQRCVWSARSQGAALLAINEEVVMIRVHLKLFVVLALLLLVLPSSMRAQEATPAQ
jgi:hypothetical protein